MTPATLRRFVSTAACGGVNPTPTYAPATDTATAVNTLAADACVYVFIVADTPVGAANGGAANVRLTATTADAGTNGVTLTTENPGVADTAGTCFRKIEILGLFPDRIGTTDDGEIDKPAFPDPEHLVQLRAIRQIQPILVVPVLQH